MMSFLMRGLRAPWRHIYTLCWPVDAFKSSVLAILKQQQAYLSAVSDTLHEPTLNLSDAALALMQASVSSGSVYPEWVFSRGFNVNLRASFRFFLLQIDRLTDLLLASDGMNFALDKETRQVLSLELKPVIQGHLALLEVLIYFFETGLWSSDIAHGDDLAVLQNNLAEHVMWNAGLRLRLQQQKDIRDVMLRLVTALPV